MMLHCRNFFQLHFRMLAIMKMNMDECTSNRALVGAWEKMF